MLARLAIEATERLSAAVMLANGVHVVPELLGNRAPFADPQARAVIAGLGMETDINRCEDETARWSHVTVRTTQ